ADLDDDEAPVALQQEGVGLEGDAVALVGRDEARPEGLGQEAEHGAAVEPEGAAPHHSPGPPAHCASPMPEGAHPRARRAALPETRPPRVGTSTAPGLPRRVAPRVRRAMGRERARKERFFMRGLNHERSALSVAARVALAGGLVALAAGSMPGCIVVKDGTRTVVVSERPAVAQDALDRIALGVTTESEVRALLGAPTSRAHVD